MVGTFCGDLSYILANLVTSPIDLPGLPNWLNVRELQGFRLPLNKLLNRSKWSSETRLPITSRV